MPVIPKIVLKIQKSVRKNKNLLRLIASGGVVPAPLTEKKFVKKMANAIKMIFTSATKILFDNF